MVGKVVGPFQSWAEDMRKPVLKTGLRLRMSKQLDRPTLLPIISVEDMRRLEDGHRSENLTSVRHKLLSNPLNVRRLGPTFNRQFDKQE